MTLLNNNQSGHKNVKGFKTKRVKMASSITRFPTSILNGSLPFSEQCIEFRVMWNLKSAANHSEIGMSVLKKGDCDL